MGSKIELIYNKSEDTKDGEEIYKNKVKGLHTSMDASSKNGMQQHKAKESEYRNTCRITPTHKPNEECNAATAREKDIRKGNVGCGTSIVNKCIL